jgi:hypothetical protein
MNRKIALFSLFLAVAVFSLVFLGGISPAWAADDLTTASVNGK